MGSAAAEKRNWGEGERSHCSHLVAQVGFRDATVRRAHRAMFRGYRLREAATASGNGRRRQGVTSKTQRSRELAISCSSSHLQPPGGDG